MCKHLGLNKLWIAKLQIKCCNLNYLNLYFFLDIQECRDGLHNCDQVCIELNGDFECACNGGFELENDNATCSGM